MQSSSMHQVGQLPLHAKWCKFGPSSTVNSITRNDLVTGDAITVEVFDANGCSDISSPITMTSVRLLLRHFLQVDRQHHV